MRKYLSKGALTGVLVATSLMATACPEAPPYGGPPVATRTFMATTVTVNSSNDGWNIACWEGCDEPRSLNVGFRVKIGVANSASGQSVYGANPWPGLVQQGPAEPDGSHTFINHPQNGDQRGTLTFSNIAMPDLLDLAQGAPVEIVGVWAWKVEDDGVLSVPPTALASAAATAIASVLNSTLATSTMPAPEGIVGLITSALGNVGFFNTVWAGITAILPGFTVDDIVGSAMYVGVGSSGTLASIIDGVTSGVAFPAVPIPVVSRPPDIGGGSIFSLGVGTKSFTNNYTNDGVDGQHTMSYTFG
ncbi:MAG: hypothetical protein K1X38_17040 [Microthrixaceae bacterium]|nr:hypothetical protein [Microthrixaceae bacterium]